MFAETFRKFTFLLLSNSVVKDTVDIQPNLVGWCHLTRLESYFWCSQEKRLVRSGKLGAAKNPALLDMSTTTNYEYMMDHFPCPTANELRSSVSETKIRLSSSSHFSRSQGA